MNRGLIESSTDDIDVSSLLLCKGHLGSETVMASGILMCDDGTFLEFLDQGLDAALDAASGFEYLPREGKDFILRDVKVKFGASVVAWKAMVPPSTTENTETALIEQFYMNGAKFAVLQRGSSVHWRFCTHWQVELLAKKSPSLLNGLIRSPTLPFRGHREHLRNNIGI